MTHNDLQGKVAIVTGGARGIGESIVKVLASRGASIVINYTSSAQSANALVEHIKSTEGEALAVQANIGELDGAKKIVDAAVKAYGKIDIIVNNAGIAEFHPVTQVDTDSFERQYNVNVRGPLLLVKESAPHLQEYGRIINLSSVGARNGFPGGSVYAGTKGALESMSRVWASELAGKWITSNCVNPGPVATEMAKSQTGDVLKSLQELVNKAAFKRMGEVEEISNVVAFLASPDSQWITGDVLNTNGGSLFP